MLLNPFILHTPKNLSEAVQLYANLDNVKINAGGTFLLGRLKLLKKKGTKTPKNIISLRKVKELQGIFINNETFTIKSMVTLSDLFNSDLLTDNCSILRKITKDIATTPIRNMATVGGNLTCRYTWTELPAIMTGLEAEMHFVNSKKEEETFSAEEFFQKEAKTDKIFTGITIKRDKRISVSYQRVKKSPNVDIPLITLFIKTIFEGTRFTQTKVIINNGVNFVKRDCILENFLNKNVSSDNLSEEALKHLDTAIYEERGADYKKHMFKVCLKKAIKELVEQNK